MSHSPALLKTAVLHATKTNGDESQAEFSEVSSLSSEPIISSNNSSSNGSNDMITTTIDSSTTTTVLSEGPTIEKTQSTPTTTIIAESQTTSTAHQVHKKRRLLFKARMSKFDISNPETSSDPFRGFFTLFWLVMAFYVIQTAIRCYEQEGVILSLGFFRLFSKDGLALLVSDMTMVATTMCSVVFSKMLMLGIIHYETTGWVIQHVCQTVFLFFNIYWTFWRDWPWVQSGFFTLHTIVMMMKMHSYTAFNGELSIKYRRLKSLKEYIPKWIAEHKHDDHADHNKELETMESEVSFLQDELVQGNARYPDNITFANYFDYLLVPSLVYSMEYPRTEKIRPWYVFEKTVATLGSFLLLYITTERYILPKLYDPNTSDLRVSIELLLPFMTNYLLIFYIIFECILNGFAEISRFADRNFYDDWWNSITYDEFARKWNKPVHHWLLRHVYAQSIESYRLSKANATFVTFLFSSCLHELVLVIVTRRIRMYLFVLQMLQLPLIMIGRHPLIRKYSMVGNIVFWLSMFVGLPLLAILYCREAFWSDAVFGTRIHSQ